MKLYHYFVRDAKILADGVIRIGWRGTNGHSFSTGVYDVSPDGADYEFWRWLTLKLKRRWYQFWPLPGLDEQALARFRHEYEQQRAQHAN